MRASDRQFALFLRPFSVTRKLWVINPYKNMDQLWPGAVGQPASIDLELLLSDIFDPATPLIGLGEPGDQVIWGIGRIREAGSLAPATASEQQLAPWQISIEKLARAARVILVIPAISDGTKWELDYLVRNGFLNKCVFIMPPSRKGDVEMAANWRNA